MLDTWYNKQVSILWTSTWDTPEKSLVTIDGAGAEELCPMAVQFLLTTHVIGSLHCTECISTSHFQFLKMLFLKFSLEDSSP